MAFKHHRIQQIAMLVLLVICSVGLGWALTSHRFHLVIVFAVIIVATSILVYQLLTLTHKEMLFFFKALKNDDTSIKFNSEQRSKIVEELHRYMDALNQGLKDMRIKSELREQYFSRILENLSSGLIVARKTGHIKHVNPEALRLLNLPQLTHLKALKEVDKKLYQLILSMRSLEQVEAIVQDGPGSRKVLGVQMVEISLKGEDLQVYTMDDMSAGMERKEIDDWIRLIRVMSHEIMNSLAPITSISTTLKELWAQPEREIASEKEKEARIRQTVKGLDAIAEQSEGLTTFFESYRVLSRIPDPVLKELKVCELLEKLETLVTSDELNTGIIFSFHCEDMGMTLLADEQMIQNVLLNLVKNAVQAVGEVQLPSIHISARFHDPQLVIEIADNGHGIPEDIAEEIFMPFFTTREQGTGVGLSYSRQVVNMNKGRIEFESLPGRTVFRLIF